MKAGQKLRSGYANKNWFKLMMLVLLYRMKNILNWLILITTVLIISLSSIADGARNLVASSSFVVVINSLCLFFLLMIFDRSHFKNILLKYVYVWICLLIWLIVTFIQTYSLFGYVNYDPNSSCRELNLGLLYCCLIFMLSCLFDSKHKVGVVLLILVFLALSQTILGLINYYNGQQPTGWRPTHWAGLRVTGTYINRNFYGNLVVLCLGIAIVPIVARRFRRSSTEEWLTGSLVTIIFILLTILLCAGIVLSGSRGAALSLVIGFAVIFGLIALSPALRVHLIGIGMVALGVSVFFGAKVLSARFSRHFFDLDDKLAQWGATLELISQRLFLGYGPGSYEIVYKSNIPFNTGSLTYNHAHSDLLELLLEQGLIGALPLFCFAGLVLYYGVKSIMRTRDSVKSKYILIALFGIIGMLAHGLYDFPFQVPTNVAVYCILVAIVLSINRSFKKKRIKHD